MSYINKKGKTTSTRLMIIRQQASDVIAYHEIKTTLTKAKETQKRVEKMITWAKDNTVANHRLANRYLVNTQKLTTDQLLHHLFNDIGPAFKNRNGGYTRVLKLGKRIGDSTEMAILQLVDKVNAYKPKPVKAKKPAKVQKPVAAKVEAQPAQK